MPFTLNNIHHSDAIGITDFCLSDMFWPSEYGTCSLYSDPDCIQIPTARGFIFPPVYDGITQSFEWNQIFIFVELENQAFYMLRSEQMFIYVIQ